MAQHGDRGFVDYNEDFLVTAIGDLPEVDVQSAAGVTTAILANQLGGVVEIPVATSNDDDVAAVTTNLNWNCGDGGTLIGVARVKWDTSVADMMWFIGFGDSIATSDEVAFSVTGNVYDIAAMSDAIGFVFDNDATNPSVVAVAGKGDALTYQSRLGGSYTPVVNTYVNFRVEVGPGAVYIEWSINGMVVASTRRAAGDSTSYISTTAPLAMGVWNYEQGTANEIELDRLYVRKGRADGD